MIMEVIAYIRSLFPPKRKRCSEDIDIPVSAKIRKICLSPITSTPEEDWYNTSRIHRPKKGVMEPEDNLLRPSWLIKPPIVIDDDDLNDVKKKQTYGASNKIHVTSTPHLTSTPNFRRKQNGFDDPTFRGTFSIQKSGIKKKFDKQSSYFNTNFSEATTKQSNFFKSLQKNVFPSIIHKNGVGFKSNAVDISFRLEEKRKYRELLNKTCNLSTNRIDLDSFAKYSTPMGRISPKIRNQKLLVTSKKPTTTVDLTNGDCKSPNGSKLSTKDTIIKVLDDIDAVEVKDSDSDVEELPRPPTPKPDIKVERVNSLKTSAHQSESHHADWITNTIKKHKEGIAKREREIALAKAHFTQIRGIADEVRSKQLEEEVKKCLHIKDIVLPIEIEEDKLPALTDIQEDLIINAFSRKSPDEVLARKFNLNITRRDMMTLAGLNWLNDEIINFYMNLIIERGKESKYPKAYAFNTFFYQKLLREGQAGLKRWTKKVDLFSYDLIAVPVHMSMHWCMAIIDFRNKHIGYYDSMGGKNNKCLAELSKYLMDEHLSRKGSEYDLSDWCKESLKEIPQQMNGCDCGVFACTFAEFLTRNAPISFAQEDMPYLRKKMVVEIIQEKLLI